MTGDVGGCWEAKLMLARNTRCGKERLRNWVAHLRQAIALGNVLEGSASLLSGFGRL